MVAGQMFIKQHPIKMTCICFLPPIVNILSSNLKYHNGSNIWLSWPFLTKEQPSSGGKYEVRTPKPQFMGHLDLEICFCKN